MSFYVSQSNQNISTTPQPRQSHLNPPPWPTNPLDQLVFQDNDNPSHIPMVGLRRPNPSQPPPTQPSQLQSTDQGFSLADSAVAQLPNFPPHDSVDNHRFLLDSTRLDFVDDALQTRPIPPTNNYDPKQNPATSNSIHPSAPTPPPHTTHANPANSHPPSQTQHPPPPALAPSPIYRQSWDPSAVLPVNPSPAVPSPDSFGLSEDLARDPTPQAYASSGGQAKELGLGKYVQRLINFNRDQQRGTKHDSLERFWKPLIADYFAPEATLHMDLNSHDSQKLGPFKVPVEALPRIWKSKLDAGVKEERMLLEDPNEFLLPSGVVVVDCPRTTIITVYEYCMVLTDGRLRVSFHRNKKILLWRFSTQKHEEVYPRSSLSMGRIPPLASFESGMPYSVVIMMMIANDVNNLADKITEEISKIASDPQKVTNLMNPGNPTVQRMGDAFANLARQSNGNAFRALSSVFDGASLEHSMQAASMGMGLAASVAGNGARGFAGDLDMDVKNAMKNESIVPNLRDAFNSWNSEQAVAQQQPNQQSTEQEQAVVFPNLLDEAVGSPLLDVDRLSVQRTGRKTHGDLNLPTKPANISIGAKQSEQSLIDAVNAAASGQSGWGVGTPVGPDMGNNEAAGDGLDPSLQLIETAGVVGLRLRRESAAGTRSSVSRRGVPPGLSMFTPQANEAERRKRGPNRRGRGSRGGSKRSAGSGGGRAATKSRVKDMKDINEVLHRMGNAKPKRGSGSESVLEGSGSGNGVDFGRSGQEQDVGMAPGKKGPGGDGGKVGKDSGHVSRVRRGASRSIVDERLEKRQKTGQDAEQK